MICQVKEEDQSWRKDGDYSKSIRYFKKSFENGNQAELWLLCMNKPGCDYTYTIEATYHDLSDNHE